MGISPEAMCSLSMPQFIEQSMISSFHFLIPVCVYFAGSGCAFIYFVQCGVSYMENSSWHTHASPYHMNMFERKVLLGKSVVVQTYHRVE